jgi:hypothetical protein
MVKEKKIGAVKKGEKVLIKTPDYEILGTIKSKKKDSIILENPEIVKRPRRMEVKKKKIKNILVLEKNILEKIWPTLVFKERESTPRKVR